MRSYKLALALLALPAALAVSLDDFTPRPSQLPSACQQVYTRSITGCSGDDWTSGKSSQGCSKGCVEALQALSTDVTAACANQGIQGQNIIVAFLAGQGPQSLCSNAGEYLSAGDKSSSSAESTPSKTSSSSTTSSTRSASSTNSAEKSSTTESSTSTVLSGTATATSLATTAASTGLIVDSSTQPTGSPTQASYRSSQTNMVDSGGGSPFDSEGNSNSGTSLSCSSFATALFTTLFVIVTAI